MLEKLSYDYIKFMSNVGSLKNTDLYELDMSSLFSENVLKIENGKIILQNIELLKNQLRNARLFGFPWDMDILDIIIDEQKNASAIRFSWNSEKVGMHITTAILKFNENKKIIEINEVYNKFADVTH